MQGQYFSFDSIVASVIFVLALVMLLSAWQNVRILLDHQTNALGLEALRIGESILAPGSLAPPAGHCEEFGAAVSWQDRRLDSTKLDECQKLDVQTLQGKWGSPYTATLIVRTSDGGRRWVLGTDITDIAQFDRARVQDLSHVRKIAALWEDDLQQEEVVSIDVYVYR